MTMPSVGWLKLSCTVGCQFGFSSLVERMLSKPSAQSMINHLNRYGDAPLHLAAKMGMHIVRSDIRSISGWPVAGRSAVVHHLLKAGASVGLLSGGQRTALHFAADKGRTDAARLLLDAKIDPDCKDRWVYAYLVYLGNAQCLLVRWGNAPLHVAARVGASYCHPMVVALLDGGASVNVENGAGKTALHFAAKMANVQLASILLQRGANPCARDKVVWLGVMLSQFEDGVVSSCRTEIRRCTCYQQQRRTT